MATGFDVVKLPKNNSTVKLPDELNSILQYFKSEYQCEPDFFVRVPGRVNLIGEHIDYCGYGVCPMAIQQNIFVAVKTDPTSTNLNLANIQAEKFKKFQCDLSDFKIVCEENKGPTWENYFLCGVKGILEKFDSKPIGMLAAVSGDIPPSAGLSSSSALVCASALLTAYANNISYSKLELAALCAKAEHYIGTQGGGMDQAIALLATDGCAKYIEFEPELKISDVQLPLNATFVIIQSLVVKNKAASSDFNTRVVECRLAGQVLAKKLNLNWKMVSRLAKVQNLLEVNLETMVDIVSQNLHDGVYSKEEICTELEVSENDLNSLSLTNNTVSVKNFKLKQRAMHVFSEALRVEKFIFATTVEEAGKLMNESHDSLTQLYECSHSRLDELVALCRKAGSLGARLTGAGWGGCVVALVTIDKVSQFISEIKDNYFSKIMNYNENLDSVIFSSKPSNGAQIIVLH